MPVECTPVMNCPSNRESREDIARYRSANPESLLVTNAALVAGIFGCAGVEEVTV
jgi:hypothetical protein